MHIVVDGEHGVLWTAHLAVLIALAQAVWAQCIAELAHLHEQLSGILACLCKQLGSILAVNKDDLVNATLVEEGELVEHVGELGGGVLPGALEPLDALAGALQEAKLTIELQNAEVVHGTGVMTRSASGSDLSPSRTQPGPTPGCFSPVVSRDVMHHVTQPRHTHLHACVCSPMNVWPQRVHARLLLMSPTCDPVYKSSLYSETN